MIIANKLKDLRINKGIQQRKIAAALDIDTATYSKIENGILSLRKEHLSILSGILDCNLKELHCYWLADKIYNLVNEEDQAIESLKIVINKLNKQQK